jgi:HSP20 family protein
MLQKSKNYENYLKELLNTDSVYGWNWVTTPTNITFNTISENNVLTNVLESDYDYRYELSTPGFNKSEITIEIVGKRITVTGERKTEKNETKVNYVTKEYHTTKFTRTFETPENVILDEVNAKVENGITTLFVPKETPTKNKTAKRLVEVL